MAPVEKCPACGSDDFSIARNMRGDRHCSRCHATWLPQPKEWPVRRVFEGLLEDYGPFDGGITLWHAQTNESLLDRFWEKYPEFDRNKNGGRKVRITFEVLP